MVLVAKDSRKAIMIFDELLKKNTAHEAELLKKAINSSTSDYNTLMRLHMVEESRKQLKAS